MIKKNRKDSIFNINAFKRARNNRYKNNLEACREAVKIVSEGKADILMKGLVQTAEILRVVLDKEIGLRTGRTLSHVAVLSLLITGLYF